MKQIKRIPDRGGDGLKQIRRGWALGAEERTAAPCTGRTQGIAAMVKDVERTIEEAGNRRHMRQMLGEFFAAGNADQFDGKLICNAQSTPRDVDEIASELSGHMLR